MNGENGWKHIEFANNSHSKGKNILPSNIQPFAELNATKIMFYANQMMLFLLLFVHFDVG